MKFRGAIVINGMLQSIKKGNHDNRLKNHALDIFG